MGKSPTAFDQRSTLHVYPKSIQQWLSNGPHQKTSRSGPSSLEIYQRKVASREYIWRNKHRVKVPIDIIRCCILVYNYLESGDPWEHPVGHIVPRMPSFVSTGYACLKAIAVQIPRLQVWCLLPFSEALCARIDWKEVHINVLEFIALLLSYIIVQEKVKMQHPFAKYQLLSQVCSESEHIKGSDNVIADTISRPHELFTPHLTHVWKNPYHELIQQVYLRYEEKKLWEVFLPSAELLSALNLTLSSDCSWERQKPRRTTDDSFMSNALSMVGNLARRLRTLVSCSTRLR